MFTNTHRITSDPLNWYWFDDGFTDAEIVVVESLAASFPVVTANVTADAIVDEDLRKSSLRWLHRNTSTDWLFQKIIKFADLANENLWGFDMYDSKESIQYTEYYENGGHYGYHLDIGASMPLNQRKISVTVQLSDPSSYDGGDFEILRGQCSEALPRKKGATIIFPSYILHRVTPVTRGVRKSLVLWLGGASFK